MDIGKAINRKEFQDSYQKAIINLLYTANFFRDIHNSLFEQYNIQTQHFNVLRILQLRHPEPLSPGKIKEVLVDKGRDLTRLLDKLEAFQWIKRCKSLENKRNVLVSLTEEGLQFTIDVYQELNTLNEGMRLMDEKEYELLSNLLDKMRKDS